MTRDLIFEIGVEEIPASYIQPALDQIHSLADAYFKEQHLEHKGIQAEGTPRRLVLSIKDLQERQDDRVEELQGPAAKVAFDAEGKPTQVGIGFAKGKGLDVSKLSIRPTPKGDYVFAKVFTPGQYTQDLLEIFLPALTRKLTFPKSMRWGEGGPLRFARPINWLLALYGDRTVKFELDGIPCSNLTRGHRFLAPKAFVVKNAAEYSKKLKAAHVQLSMESRCELIREQLEAACKKIKCQGIVDDELVAVTANLVEAPKVLQGEFEARYLVLPEAVIIKALREHQYCFSARDSQGKLAPVFLTVTNGTSKNTEGVKLGNARVMRARLEDAAFFFAEDQKETLETRLEELKHVVWQESLGTVFERVERLERLAQWIAEKLAPSERDHAARAAKLCKSDLVTLMIGEKEYASLQGVMGGIYARLSGESEEVAEAIAGHYRPRFAGDAIPATRAGQIVALADKLDDLAGSFGVGQIPTGSQDPYALRRKATGLVAILSQQDKDLSFEELAGFALSLYGGKITRPVGEVLAQLKDFHRQRLEASLSDQGFSQDLIDATLCKRSDLTREAQARAKALAKVRSRDDFEMVASAFSRVNNILSKVTEIKAVNPALLEDGAEKVLHERFLAARPVIERLTQGADYEGAFTKMADLRSAIDAYFSDVMVMAEDPAVRLNRLSFLASVSQTLNLLADFTKLAKK